MSWFGSSSRFFRFWIQNHRKELMWYVGVPVIVFVVTFLPFWIMRLVLGIENPFRIKIVGQMIFDLYAYLEFMSQALAQSGGGVHLRQFESLVRFTADLFPYATVTELWLILRWIFGCLTWWMLAWTIGYFAPQVYARRRWYATLFWFAVWLPLGFRPGVFSWFMPFVLLDLCGGAWLWELLKQRRWKMAVPVSVGLIVISQVYAWLFLFVVCWILALWTVFLISVLNVRRWAVFAFGVTTLGVIVSYLIPRVVSSEVLKISLETLARNGLAFTHAPMLSMMLLASGCWLGVWIIFSRGADKTDRLELIWIGWILTCLLWLSSLFTGTYLHNDHFRLFVLLWSWISVVAVFESEYEMKTKKEFYILSAIGIISLLFIIKICIAPYVLNGDQLNIIHLFVWLTIVISILRLVTPRSLFRDHAVCMRIAACCIVCFVGVYPYLMMCWKEAGRLPNEMQMVAAIDWTRSHTSTKDQLCVDPEVSTLFAAFSERSVFFTQEDIYNQMTDIELYRRMEVLASYANPSSADRVFDQWKQWLWERGTACNQFSGLRVLTKRLTGLEEDYGCDMRAKQNDERAISSFKQIHTLPLVQDFSCNVLVTVASHPESWNVQRRVPAYHDQFVSIYLLDRRHN